MRAFFQLASLLLVAPLVSAPVALAQVATEGSLRGFVRDAQGATIPGATLTAVSQDAPATYTAVTDEQGFYRLQNLPPATYVVTFEMTGFAKLARENVQVRAGLNVSLDVTLELGSVTDAVTVRADTPLLEVRNQAQSVNISGRFQDAIPTSNRQNWSDILTLTPGTVHYDRGADTGANSAYFVHGAGIGAHVIQMDGADIGSGLSGQTRYNYIGAGSLQDTQVKVSGMDASAPLGYGAVINMVTQSGTNRPRGTASFTGQSRRWTAENVPNGTSGKIDLAQTDLSFGGPINKDRAWVFASYRHARVQKGIARTAQQVADLRALFPDVMLPDGDTRNHQPLVKLTGRLSNTQWIEGFMHSGRDSTLSGPATATVFTAGSVWGGQAASGQWRATWGNTLATKLAVAYANNTSEGRLDVTNGPRREVYRTVNPSSGRLNGNTLLAIFDSSGATAQLAPADKLTITADATYFIRGPWGSHELQVGAYLQPKRRSAFFSVPTNDGFVLERFVLRSPLDSGQGFIPFHRQTIDTSGEATLFNDVRKTDYAYYVQDTWRPTRRLTLHAGVRVDVLRQRDAITDVLLQDTTAVGPRLGVTYMLTGDGRNVVRATWGRIHANPGTTATALGSRSAAVTDTYDLNRDGAFETTFVTPATTSIATDRLSDLAGFRQPRTDEWTLDYQRQLPGQIAIDVGVVHRQFRDRVATIEVNGIYENGVFQGYRDENVDGIFLTTSNVWNWPVYTGISVTASKRSDRVELIATYTRQFRHLAGTWQPNDPASFIQPHAFANDKNIGDVETSGGGDSLSGFDMANGFSQWRDHAFNAGAAYRGPWSLEMATSLTAQSGAWSGPIVRQLGAPDPAFGPPTVTLSNGRIVSNPLATPIRFSFPARGEGQFAGQWVPEWNLRFGWSTTKRGVTLRPAVDVLNVLNTGRSSRLIGGANQEYNANFRRLQPTVVPPRAVQLSIRTSF